MNKLYQNIIRELLDMEDKYIYPVWTIRERGFIICAFCGALSHDYRFIEHDAECIINRALAILAIDEE